MVFTHTSERGEKPEGMGEVGEVGEAGGELWFRIPCSLWMILMHLIFVNKQRSIHQIPNITTSQSVRSVGTVTGTEFQLVVDESRSNGTNSKPFGR